MKKIARTGLVFLAASCLLGAPMVAAVPYGAGGAAVQSSGPVPEAGGPVTLTATGMCPGNSVRFLIGGISVTDEPVLVGADGTASLTLANYVPGSDLTITAISNGTGACAASPTSQLTLAQSFAPVTTGSGSASGAGAGSNLPTAGTNSVSTLQVAGAATIVGAGLIGVSVLRRRQRRTAAAV